MDSLNQSIVGTTPATVKEQKLKELYITSQALAYLTSFIEVESLGDVAILIADELTKILKEDVSQSVKEIYAPA